MKQGNIGAGQAVILLLVSRCYNMLNYIPAFDEKTDGMAILYGNLLAAVIQLLLLVPALLLYRKMEGQNVITAAYNVWKPLGWVFAFCYFLSSLAQLAGTFMGFEYFMVNAVYPNASAVFIIVTLSLTCFWCGRGGFEGIARAGAIVFVFLLLSLGFISAVSVASMDLYNFHPILSDPAAAIFRAALSNISKSSELYLLILMYPKIKGSVGKSSLGLIASAFLLLEITGLVLQGVLGEFALTQTFPYYTLASITDTSILQRLDSLHMMLWVFCAFIRCTLLVILSNYCIRMILPQKAHRFVLPVMFVISTGAAVLLAYSTEYLKALNTANSMGGVVALLTAGFPLLMLLIPRRRKRPHNNSEGRNPSRRDTEEDFTVVPDTD